MKITVFFLVTLLLCSQLAWATSTRLPTRCVAIDNHPFTVEIATTREQQALGLQHRKSLSAKRGMVFPFTPASPQVFWMKDCNIPLDLLFFKDNKLVNYVDNAPPCQLEAKDCPRYPSGQPVDAVVELQAGVRQAFNMKTGSKLALLASCRQRTRRPRMPRLRMVSYHHSRKKSIY